MERTIAAEPYRLTVLRDDPAAPILYTVSEAGDARALFASLPAPRPTLVCIEGADWDRDLSPWPAEKVFRGGDDFSGGTEDFLHTLLTKIVPAAEGDLSPAWRGLFGYSLAAYLSAHPLLGQPTKIYLSLGDREEKAKNPRMQQVRIATEQAKTILQNQGVPCAFELNPGGHFQDVLERQRRAVLSLL